VVSSEKGQIITNNYDKNYFRPLRKANVFQCISKRVQKWRMESGPSWRVYFWFLYFIRCSEILQAAMCEKKLEATLTQQHPRQNGHKAFGTMEHNK
jgi:hypothetical protein